MRKLKITVEFEYDEEKSNPMEFETSLRISMERIFEIRKIKSPIIIIKEE